MIQKKPKKQKIMKKVTILLFAVFTLASCSTGESKCEGEGCDSTKVAVDTVAITTPLPVDTNTVVLTDTTEAK